MARRQTRRKCALINFFRSSDLVQEQSVSIKKKLEKKYDFKKEIKVDSKRFGPFAQARKEFEAQRLEKEQRLLESDKKQKELQQKVQQRKKQAIKMQMKTKRGQPLMNNLIENMVSKLQKD